MISVMLIASAGPAFAGPIAAALVASPLGPVILALIKTIASIPILGPLLAALILAL
jgi:hypothetical protein